MNRAGVARCALLSVCIIAAASDADAQNGVVDASWRTSPLWDDGMAEFSAYEVTWARYGNLYPGRAVLVLVKEPWAPDLNVKADQPRTNGFEVLKLNHARDVPTGIYTYHQMASVFCRRDSGKLVKIAAASIELCGISSAEMVDGQLSTHSYFDGQGDRRLPYPDAALPEDGLPAMLRDYVEGSPPAELLVFPSLLMGRYATLKPTTYKVSKRDAGQVEVPAGSEQGVEFMLRSDDGNLVYTFSASPPFRLLRFSTSAGTEYRLAKSERIPYWTMHDPGGEAWLPERLR